MQKNLAYTIWTSNIPTINISSNEPNCGKLFDSKEEKNVVNSFEMWKDESFIDYSGSCSSILKKYFLDTLDRTEKTFPIAFTILANENVQQTERLLRTIYRPWNFYCIHVDKGVSEYFFQTIERITKCLNDTYKNVINKRLRVHTKNSSLKADLNCMKELYERYKSWKYLINLSEKEFPLKTNKELVQILKTYNGANNIEGTYKGRIEKRVPKVKMPFPLVWYEGDSHITGGRHFIQYIFQSLKAQIILKTLESSLIPEEQFFATLNFNGHLRIPGSFIGDVDDNRFKEYFLTRFKNLGGLRCKSRKRVLKFCIFGVGDLPKLVESKHLFASKFYENFQPATLRCLEKWYYEKVKNEEITGTTKVDVEYYKSLIFVVNQFQPLKKSVLFY